MARVNLDEAVFVAEKSINAFGQLRVQRIVGDTHSA